VIGAEADAPSPRSHSGLLPERRGERQRACCGATRPSIRRPPPPLAHARGYSRSVEASVSEHAAEPTRPSIRRPPPPLAHARGYSRSVDASVSEHSAEPTRPSIRRPPPPLAHARGYSRTVDASVSEHAAEPRDPPFGARPSPRSRSGLLPDRRCERKRAFCRAHTPLHSTPAPPLAHARGYSRSVDASVSEHAAEPRDPPFGARLSPRSRSGLLPDRRCERQRAFCGTHAPFHSTPPRPLAHARGYGADEGDSLAGWNR